MAPLLLFMQKLNFSELNCCKMKQFLFITVTTKNYLKHIPIINNKNNDIFRSKRNWDEIHRKNIARNTCFLAT